MRKLWIGFWSVIILSFAVLGWAGIKIYQEKPPIPARVVTTEGVEMILEGDITAGQNVWQSLGGMEVGSIWGHGGYVAPDWTADWLHRECVFILNAWGQENFGSDFDKLTAEQQAVLQARLKSLMRTNTYDKATNSVKIDPIRQRAFDDNLKYYSDLYTNGNTPYSIPAGTLTDPTKLRQLASFFFWTSWAASTNRPNDNITYTSNWPHEPLIDNEPTGDAIIWTGFSIIMLLGGIGLLVWYHASQPKEPLAERIPANDPLIADKPTPSQKAIIKYFWMVAGLFLVQIIMGVITAHYGVEGNGFYGIPLAKWLPYAVTRTWHTQLGIFWIATAWLAAGLYIGPAVCGFEPKDQRLGVNVLFGALIVVVVGSMAGEWLSVKGMLSGDSWFYFGHQGYEYVDLGRVWQIGLLIGLFLWLYLVGRNVFAAIRKGGEQKTLLTMFIISAIAIGAILHGRSDVGERAPICPSSNTGAGGWCIFGWKDSSRSSRPW